MSLCPERLEADAFKLICYMLSSAANLPAETKSYGPFRLIDAASRLIDMMENSGVRSERLATIRAGVEEGKYDVIVDETTFRRTLENLVVQLVLLM